MKKMNRYAIYYAPRRGEFAMAAAAWLGWDLEGGCAVAQPVIDMPIAELTSDPRKYGFHGTLKAPFRLADGVSLIDLQQGVKTLAAELDPVEMPALDLVDMHGFLAFTPTGDNDGLKALSTDVVRFLDPYRAPLTPSEYARRRPDDLTQRQRELLDTYGYPFVMEEFQFHLTLTNHLSLDIAAKIKRCAQTHFADVMPRPFVLQDLCLCGEDSAGRFHILHRYALNA